MRIIYRSWKICLLLLASQVASFSPSSRRLSRRSTSQLHDTNPKKDNRSAASRARREEDESRLKRKEDVVIGKTSAKRGATDFALNPKSTEEQWMKQATRLEQKIFQYTEQGMEALKMLNLEDASAAFEEVFRLKPDAYLWQAGIVKFYMNDFKTAANIFAKNAAIYETKFGGKASEERIWRQACVLKIATLNIKTKKGKITKEDLDKIQSQLAPLPKLEEDPDLLFVETRKVIRIANDLFEASINSDAGGVILSRAKLRSIGGNFDDSPKFDLKQWKLHSWFFLGLHYDALGEVGESKECMKMALRTSPNAGNADNILFVLPLIHMCERDWFDDDDMEANPLNLLQLSPPEEGEENDKDAPSEERQEPKRRKLVDADPLVSDSIRKSIAKMNLPELQKALLARGVKSSGCKQDLQDRLYDSLMTDAGLAP